MHMSFRERIARFLYGRNGPDTLYNVCVWSAVVLAIIGCFFSGVVGYIFFGLYVLLFAYSVFRLLSKNVYQRQKENSAFVSFFRRIKDFFSFQKKKAHDKDHVYRKCPQCKSKLRLPKKKGRHTVRCPRCTCEFKVNI